MSGTSLNELYDALKADGAVSGTRENFRSFMLAPGKQGYQNRKKLYDALYADGAITSKSYEEFREKLGIAAVKPQQKVTQATATNTPRPATTAQKAMQMGRKQQPQKKPKVSRTEAYNNSSEFVQGLYSADRRKQELAKDVDYTKTTVANIAKTNSNVDKVNTKTAAREFANKERRRRNASIVDTGNENVNEYLIKSEGQLEDEADAAANELVGNSGDLVNGIIDAERKKGSVKASEELRPHLDNPYMDAAIGGFSNADIINKYESPEVLIENIQKSIAANVETLRPAAEKQAKSLGISSDAYLKQMVLPKLVDKAVSDFQNSELAKSMPKNGFEYFVREMTSANTLGKIGALLLKTKAQRQIDEEAMARTNAGENKNYKPSTATTVTADIAGMVTDPVFAKSAKAGGAVAGKLFGGGTKMAALMANGNLAQRLGIGAVNAVTSGGVTGFVFDSIGSVIQNYSTGEDTSLGNTLSVALHGGLKGTANFATMSLAGVPLGQLGRSVGLGAGGSSFWGNAGRVTAKIGLESAKTYMEGMGMYLGGYVAGKMDGATDANGKPIEFDLWGGTLESLPTAIGFRLQHAVGGLRGGRKDAQGNDMGWVRSTVANMHDFFTSDKAKSASFVMTDDERRQIMESYHESQGRQKYNFDNVVTAALNGKKKRKYAENGERYEEEPTSAGDVESDVETVHNVYDKVMADPNVSWDAKAKFSAMVTGIMPSARPMADYVRFGSDAENKYVCEYSKDGELLSKVKYDNANQRDALLFKSRMTRENNRMKNAVGGLLLDDKNNYGLQNAFYQAKQKEGYSQLDILAGMQDPESEIGKEYSRYAFENGSFREIAENAAKSCGMSFETFMSEYIKDPMKRSEEGQEACTRFRHMVEEKVFPENKVHEEQSNLAGKDVAGENGLGTEKPSNESVKAELNNLSEAETGMDELMRDNDVFGQNFAKLQEKGMSNPQIYEWMIENGLTEEQLEPFARYINANARVQGMQEATQQKIEEKVSQYTQDWSLRGTLNGEHVNGDQAVWVQDSEGRTLVVGSGEMAFDSSTGRAKEGVGDMLVCFDPNKGEMVYVKADDVTFFQTQGIEDFGNEYRRRLQVINSRAYNEAAQEQAVKNTAAAPVTEGGESSGQGEGEQGAIPGTYKIGDEFTVNVGNSENQKRKHKIIGYDPERKVWEVEREDGYEWYTTDEFLNEHMVKPTEPEQEIKAGQDSLEEKSDVGAINSVNGVPFEQIKPVGTGPFGDVYDQFQGKPKEAVAFLIQKQGGEALGALHHEAVGAIDLVWGKAGTKHSDGFGLAKLVKYHPEVVANLQDVLSSMKVDKVSPNRVNLSSDKYKAGIRLDYDGKSKTWLLTAYEKGTPSKSDKTTDTAASSLSGDTALTQSESVPSAGKDKNNSSNGNGAAGTLTFSDGTAVPMVKDKKGRPTPDYSNMTPEQAAEIMTKQLTVNAEPYVDAQIKAAQKAVKDAEKMKIDFSGEPNDIMEQQAVKDATIAAARKQLEHAEAIKKAMAAQKVAETLEAKGNGPKEEGEENKGGNDVPDTEESERQASGGNEPEQSEEEDQEQVNEALKTVATEITKGTGLEVVTGEEAQKALDEAESEGVDVKKQVGQWAGGEVRGMDTLPKYLQTDADMLWSEIHNYHGDYIAKLLEGVPEDSTINFLSAHDGKWYFYSVDKNHTINLFDAVKATRENYELFKQRLKDYGFNGRTEIIRHAMSAHEYTGRTDGNMLVPFLAAGTQGRSGLRAGETTSERGTDGSRVDEQADGTLSSGSSKKSKDGHVGTERITTSKALDAAYQKEVIKAKETGNWDAVQKMVNDAAEAAGYSADSSYQGTSAFNGSAPWGNGYFLTKEERKEAWDNGEYDGDQTLGDYIHRGIDAMNLDFIALDPRNYRAADADRKEAIDNVRDAIKKKSKTITMYRSVPASVKEGKFRNGDWVTPSRGYAVLNAKIHGWGENYRIIEEKVPVDEIWWDGNDIAEWGYGREEDYINDTDFAYKNTKNNKKLLDPVTYDDKGNVIPLSQRFNSRKSDVRYFRSKNGEVYGFTDGKKIYLDFKKMKPETALHEYTHLWTDALKRVNPKEWESVKKLFDDVEGLKEEVQRLYPELEGDALYEEMITTFSGREGAKKLEDTVRELAAKEGKTVTESVKAQGFIGKVKEALQKYWKGVADMLHIHFTTAEEVADKVLADWAKGVNPREIKGETQSKDPMEALNKAAEEYHNEKTETPANPEVQEHDWSQYKKGDVFDYEGYKSRYLFTEKEADGRVTGVTVEHLDDNGNVVGRESVPPLMFMEHYKKVANTEQPKTGGQQGKGGSSSSSSEEITDVGEKIGGARKDKYKEMQERMLKDSKQSDESLTAFIAKTPLSKIFGFDFVKMREAGVSNDAVSFVAMVKKLIPAKPRKEWKLRSWVGNVLTLYRASLKAFADFSEVQNLLDSEQFANSQLKHRFDAYMAVGGYDGGLDVGNAELSQFPKDSGAGMYGKNGEWISHDGYWYVANAGKYTDVYKTREEAVAALKAFAGKDASADGKGKAKEMKMVVYQRKADGICYITPKGKSDIVLADGFKSPTDAFKYIGEHRGELQERYRSLLDETKVKPDGNRERKGRDWRAGKDVTADDFMKTFGFRGVEFGNWMKQEDRAKALNECYDALMDLADVCGVSPLALSLDGKLGMAFGARGGGNANAHYEPSKVVINLTKTKGAGSLAHEWFHAVDAYFARMGGAEAGSYATSQDGLTPKGVRVVGARSGGRAYWDGTKHDYITEAEYEAAIAAHPVRKEMAEAWKHLIGSIAKSKYGERSRSYANLHNSNYWKEPTEMGARAFSVWVENELSKRNATNDYLANNPKLLEEALKDEQKRFSPYPFNTDSEWMDEAFGNLFNTMQEKVDAETGHHVLFRIGDGEEDKSTELFLSLRNKKGKEYNEKVTELARREAEKESASESTSPERNKEQGIPEGNARRDGAGRHEDVGIVPSAIRIIAQERRRTLEGNRAGIGGGATSERTGDFLSHVGSKGYYGKDEKVRDEIDDRILDWAKDNGFCVSEDEVKGESYNGKVFGMGSEARVYLSNDRTKVTKFVKYSQLGRSDMGDYVTFVEEYNSIFPETSYRIVGVSKDASGIVRVVVEQPYVDGQSVPFKEWKESQEKYEGMVEQLMQQKGFAPVGDGLSFFNNDTYVTDVHYRNILFKDGKPIIVDANIRPRSEMENGDNEKLNGQVDDWEHAVEDLKDYRKTAEEQEWAEIDKLLAELGKKITSAKSSQDNESHYHVADAASNSSDSTPIVAKHIDDVAKRTGAKVNMVHSVSEITNEKAKAAIEEGKPVTGWYDEATGKVYLYMPNIHDRYTAEKTIWHETVGHKGMRGLMGENYYKFLRGVWYDLDKPENARLKELVDEELKGNPLDVYNAVEEGIARLAEDGKGEPGFWNGIKNKVVDFFREMGYRISPNTKDVKYLLWLSKNMQKNPNDPFYRMRAAAVKFRIDHEDVPDVIASNGMYCSNDGHAYRSLGEMPKAEYQEATDGRVHFRTTPSGATAIDRYHRALNAHGYMATESFMDNMLSLQELMKAVDPSIKKIEDVDSSENPYMLQNTMQGAMSDASQMFERNVMKPLDAAMGRLVGAFDGKKDEDKIRNFNLYMITKHGLERNRVFFVRDYVNNLRKDDATKNDADILQKQWDAEKKDLGDRLRKGSITLKDYYDEMDEWIRNNVAGDFDAGEHDYSGMHGVQEIDDLTAPYDDADAIQSVMDAEAKMEGVKAGSVKDFWSKVHAATSYSLYCDYKNGLQSRETYTKTSHMFDWYVPLRKYDEDTAEDVYGYVTEKGDPSSYIGSVLMKAKGRKSLSEVNVLAQIGAMGNMAISNGGKNAIKQAFMRFARNHDSEGLITEGEVWLVKDGTNADGSDRWVEAYPQIPETATPKMTSNIIRQFEADMEAKKQTGDARVMRNKADVGYKFERAKDKSQHVVDVKVNGKTHRFYINGNPRAAQALNGMLENKGAKFLKPLSSITRTMAQLCTSWSPEFVIRNICRDMQFASSNVTAKEGAKYGAKWLGYYSSLMPVGAANIKAKDLKGTTGLGLYAKYRNGTLDTSNKIHRYFKEFMENGGETGWVQVLGMKEWEQKYKADIKAERSKLNKGGKIVRDFLFGNLENMNEVAENLARFATYCTSRDAGRSAVRSAYDAKEVSTNFNRHGSGDAIWSFQNGEMGGMKKARRNTYGFLASYLRQCSMFFNAGIQSTNLLAKNVKTAPKGTLAAMMSLPFALGACIPLLNQWLISSEDEKDRDGIKDPFAEMPDYIRRNNLCIYKGGGTFITVPMAIELRAFYGLGDLVAGLTLSPEIETTRAPWADAVGCVSQLVPVMDYTNSHSVDKDPLNETVKAIAPSALGPFIEWGLNSDWKGSPIRRETTQYNKNAPAWQRAYKSTPELLMDINKKVNAMTNDVAPGNEDMLGNGFLDAVTNPAGVNHFLGSYGGGAATFATRLSKLAKADNTETSEVPFLRSFVYKPNEQSSMQRTKSKWYDYVDEMEKTMSNIDRLKSKNVPVDKRLENIGAYYRISNSKEAMKARIIEQTQKQMKRLTKLRNMSSDAEAIDNANKNIDLLMQNAVEQLDKLN